MNAVYVPKSTNLYVLIAAACSSALENSVYNILHGFLVSEVRSPILTNCLIRNVYFFHSIVCTVLLLTHCVRAIHETTAGENSADTAEPTVLQNMLASTNMLPIHLYFLLPSRFYIFYYFHFMFLSFLFFLFITFFCFAFFPFILWCFIFSFPLVSPYLSHSFFTFPF